jgi:hypothetical protein
LEEEEGFEPPALSRYGFQDRRLRPLGHSSGKNGADCSACRESCAGRATPLWFARAVFGRHMERWPRGRRRRFAKPLYGPKAVSRVRIPPSPQVLPVRVAFSRRDSPRERKAPRRHVSGLGASLLTDGRGHGIHVAPHRPKVGRAAVAHLDRAPAYEAGGSKFESCQPRTNAPGSYGFAAGDRAARQRAAAIAAKQASPSNW